MSACYILDFLKKNQSGGIYSFWLRTGGHNATLGLCSRFPETHFTTQFTTALLVMKTTAVLSTTGGTCTKAAGELRLGGTWAY